MFGPRFWLYVLSVQAMGVVLAQSVIPVSDSAFVIQPAQSIDLRVRALSATGAALANQEVIFASPLGADFGVFPDAVTRIQTSIAVRTDAAGNASARFQTSARTGWALLEATFAGAMPTASFAVTNVVTIPAAAADAQAIRMQALRSMLAAGAESAAAQMHGPFLVTAGSTVASAFRTESADGLIPHLAGAPEWFLWIDDLPRAAFPHPVRYVGGAITFSPGQFATQAVTSREAWWPSLRAAGGVRFGLVPGSRENEVPAVKLKYATGLTAGAGAEAGPLNDEAPDDACAVLVRGPGVMEASEGLGKVWNSLVDSGKVKASNVFTRTLDGPNGPIVRAMDRATLDAIFVKLKAKPCKKIYFFYDGHGTPAEWGGGLCLVNTAAAGGEIDVYTYEQFAAKVKDLGGVQVCIVNSSCFSGQLIPWMQGIGAQGEIVTVASAGKVGWQGTINRYIAPMLDSLGFNFLQLQQNLANSPVAAIKASNPQYGLVNPVAVRQMKVPYTFFWYPGTKAEAITRPLTAEASSLFQATFTASSPFIGDYLTKTVVLGPLVPVMPAVVIGYTDGLTPVNATASEAGPGVNGTMQYMGTGAIQVGRFKVTPGLCTMPVGGLCVIQIERIIPIADVDDGGTYTITIDDPRVATPNPVTVTFAQGQKTMNFTLNGVSVGAAMVTVKETQTTLERSVTVRVNAPPPPPAVAPSSCQGTWEFLVNTTRTNQEHTCCVSETSNEKLGVIIGADGMVTITGQTGNFPPMMTGPTTTGCNFTVKGMLNVSTFRTEATFSGKIAPWATFQSARTPLPAAIFDGMMFDYKVGTNGTLPGGVSANFTGMGKVNANPTCTYTVDSAGVKPTQRAALLYFDLATGSACAWSAASPAGFVQLINASGTGPARIYFQLGENLTNAARTATITVAGRSVNVSQNGLAAGAPLVSAVVNGASFDGAITAGSWVTISGTSLSTTTRVWADADFVNGALPSKLDDTSVTINGKPALVYFVSPSQLNVLAPDGLSVQDAEVIVRRGTLESNAFIAFNRPFAPGFFMFDAQSRKYAAAVNADGVLAAKADLYAGLTTRPPKPGDIVLLFLTGLGDTLPATPAARLVAAAAPIQGGATVTLGGAEVEVLFAGKISSGLYQLNIRVPTVGAGDRELRVAIEGKKSQEVAYLTVGEP